MLDARIVEQAVRANCPPNAIAVNQRALTLGRLAVTQQIGTSARKQTET
jgi:hypothetical protein